MLSLKVNTFIYLTWCGMMPVSGKFVPLLDALPASRICSGCGRWRKAPEVFFGAQFSSIGGTPNGPGEQADRDPED